MNDIIEFNLQSMLNSWWSAHLVTGRHFHTERQSRVTPAGARRHTQLQWLDRLHKYCHVYSTVV